MPCSKTVKVGVWEDGRFVGAIVFAWGPNQHLGNQFGLAMTECAELCRVALDVHRSPVSRMLRIARGMLRRQSPNLRLVISYADCDQDHYGEIYQASGWTYLGLVDSEGTKYRIHDRIMHGRSVHSRWGKRAQNLTWLRAHVDPNAQHVFTKGKHKYAMGLDAEMQRVLQPLVKPHPKRPKDSSEPPRDQRGEGGAAPTRTLHISSGVEAYTSEKAERV